ncbi:MAG: VWA domain-containing protein [Thermoanaerobacteraceae bacterium]
MSMILKQIIVITDGKSNVGGNPADAAKDVRKLGITVSAIGISDGDNLSYNEIVNIAKSGGGTYDITTIDKLGYSMTMVTQKTINKTLQDTINIELKNILGKDLNELNPFIRIQIVDYIEKLSEDIFLKCVILIDVSQSMKNKLENAKLSVLELLKSIKERRGKNEIAILAFPGEGHKHTEIISNFTSNILELEKNLKKLKTSGNTPTTFAIKDAAELFQKDFEEVKYIL